MKLIDISKEKCFITPKAIIFDWDNTLVDTQEIIKLAKEKTLLNFITTKEVSTFSSASSTKFFEAFHENEREKAKILFYKIYLEYSKNITPLPLAEECLTFFRRYKIPIFIVSNKKIKFLLSEIKTLNWNKYFNDIIGSEEVSFYDKPNPYNVLKILSNHNLPISKESWLIGDSDLDIQCACNAGISPILFGNLLEFDIKNFQNYNEKLLYAKNYLDFLSYLKK